MEAMYEQRVDYFANMKALDQTIFIITEWTETVGRVRDGFVTFYSTSTWLRVKQQVRCRSSGVDPSTMILQLDV